MKTETQKLNPEFKAKWTFELRSGRHKQTCGAGSLKGQNGTVCVLAVGAMCLGLPINSSSEQSDVYSTFEKMIGENNTTRLWVMNDDTDPNGNPVYDFNSLADWIEENL